MNPNLPNSAGRANVRSCHAGCSTTFALLTILLALYLGGSACASGPISFDITTTEAEVSYTLHNYGPRIDGDPKTPDEIEAWLAEVIKKVGDAAGIIVVYPDDRTSFKTVLELLRRFKAAGVKQFMVCNREPIEGPAEVVHSLSGTAEEIRSQKFNRGPAEK